MIPLKDNLLCRGKAPAVLFLIIVNCLVFFIELTVPAEAVDSFFSTWAVVPAKITAAFASGNPALIGMALLTVVSAMFLHGGFMHLIGNMIFLNVFGRAVENRFGIWRFLAFYIIGGFAAWGFHYITDPMSEIPALGASGSIAAVLGGYLLFYPKAECKALILAGIVPLLVTIRAYWFLLAWFISQLLPGISTMIDPSSTGIAYWAHIGGFVAGVGLAALWAAFVPVSDVCYARLPHDLRRIRLWLPFSGEGLFDDDFDDGDLINGSGRNPCGSPNCGGTICGDNHDHHDDDHGDTPDRHGDAAENRSGLPGPGAGPADDGRGGNLPGPGSGGPTGPGSVGPAGPSRPTRTGDTPRDLLDTGNDDPLGLNKKS